MAANPNFQSSGLTLTPSLTLRDPNAVDYDCVDRKIYVTDDGDDSEERFIARFNTDGSGAEKVLDNIPGMY